MSDYTIEKQRLQPRGRWLEGRAWRFELTADAQARSELVLLERTIRVGPARLKTCGVADVETEPRYRRRGYATRLLRAALDHMAAERYPLSLLYGIDDFYDRFGYATVFPVISLETRAQELLDLPAQHRVRPYRKSTDARRLAAFYNRRNAGRTGTALRSAAHYVRRPVAGVLVAVDARDRLVGYADMEVNDDWLVVPECEGRDEAALASLLRALGRRARKEGLAKLRFWLPNHHPLIDFCRRLRCHVHCHHARNGGCMARILDLPRFAAAMLPAFQARWRRAALPFRGGLGLDTDLGPLDLDLTASDCRLGAGAADLRARMPQHALAQLAFGYRSLDGLLLDRDVAVPAKARAPLGALFATRCCGTWSHDEF